MPGDKKSLDPAVLAAIVTVIGGIIIAVINMLSNRPASQPSPTAFPTWTNVPTATITFTPVPTDTVPAGEPSSTPAPDTPTPEPTETLPPPALGEDWANGCISSLWQPYPSTVPITVQDDKCLAEPVINFSADSGNLYILVSRDQNGPVENYGLFAPLPQSGSVTFTIHVNELSNVDLWMGIFPTPDINSQGLLLTVPAGNAKKHVIAQKDALTYKTIQSTQPLDQGSGFSITFKFDALSVTGTVNPSVFVTNPFSLPSTQKWLFLGYKGLPGSYRINGNFFNFQLKK